MGGMFAMAPLSSRDNWSFIGFVGQDDGILVDVIEQRVSDLPVLSLACRQAEPDRKPLRIDASVDFGREAASGATETMISIPLFAVAACWWV